MPNRAPDIEPVRPVMLLVALGENSPFGLTSSFVPPWSWERSHLPRITWGPWRESEAIRRKGREWRLGSHQVVALGLLGFFPVGKCRVSSPGVDKLLWSHIPVDKKNLESLQCTCLFAMYVLGLFLTNKTNTRNLRMTSKNKPKLEF